MERFIKGDIVVIPYKVGRLKREKIHSIIEAIIEIIKN